HRQIWTFHYNHIRLSDGNGDGTLFDSGELTWALDNNPDTVPQLTIDMTRCHRVCEADSITGNSHSILMAFKTEGDSSQPSIVYVKADTTDEIRWWQNMLNAYAKQNTIQVRPRRQMTDEKYEPIASMMVLYVLGNSEGIGDQEIKISEKFTSKNLIRIHLENGD
ncbi:hypothetical protein OSTOST_15902, partial [Ostertagia ostertagi]